MGVRSFLVHVAPGSVEDVARILRSDPSCEVYPAENRDVIVVVSDLDDRAAEVAFDERLSAMGGVDREPRNPGPRMFRVHRAGQGRDSDRARTAAGTATLTAVGRDVRALV